MKHGYIFPKPLNSKSWKPLDINCNCSMASFIPLFKIIEFCQYPECRTTTKKPIQAKIKTSIQICEETVTMPIKSI